MDRGKVYLHTYGCRMNACDSEIICSILQDVGYVMVIHPDDADFVILNCCSVREDGHIAAIRKAHEIKERKVAPLRVLCKTSQAGFFRTPERTGCNNLS